MSPPGMKHDRAPTPDLMDRFHRSHVLDTPQNQTYGDEKPRASRGQESTPNKVTARGSTHVQAIVDGNRDHKHIPHGRDSYLDKVTGNGTRAGSHTRSNSSLGVGGQDGAGRLNDATHSMAAGKTHGSRRLNDEVGGAYPVFNKGAYQGARAAKVQRAGGLDVAKHLNPKSKNARPHQKG